jgi:uncharacterized membrane protein YgdD (TMEM256/DUF423 family)
MTNTFLALAAASGFLAVALGAFGAHGLKTMLSPDLLDIFETGVRYQMYHALALLAVALLAGRSESTMLGWSGWLFVAGTVVFSGSLYILSLTGIRWLGAITPIGGVCFLAGWALLFVHAIRE